MHAIARSLIWRFAAVAILCGGVVRAEAPDVKFLFPSGLQQGQTRSLKVHGKSGTPPLHVWTNDEGLSGTIDETGEQINLTAAAETPAGLYWLRIANSQGVSELQPVIVGLLPEVTESDLQGDDGPTPPDLSTTISGVLAKSNEVDAYPVSLDVGQTLIASIDSHRLLGSPADMVLQLVSDSGFVIAQNDDHHGIDPQTVFTAPSAGTFAVRLFAFPAAPNSTIRFAGGDTYVYRLTLTTGPFVDHVSPLSIDESPDASFRVYGWNIPDADPRRTIDSETWTTRGLPYPGSFLVNRIRSSSAPQFVEPTDTEKGIPMKLPTPAAVTGHLLNSGEVDTYSVQAKAGQTLAVAVAAHMFDSPLDPVVRISGADGKLLKEADDISKDNPDVKVDVKFPEDGEYRISLTDRFAHGGMRYFYRLSVQEQQPEYRLSTPDTRYLAGSDKPLEIPVTIERRGGFDAPIQIRLIGQPEGVTCAPVESQPDGDTAKSVKLKVETDGKAGFSGPVRIVGSTEGASDVYATAPTPVAVLVIQDIWLTVVAAAPEQVEEAAH